MLDKIEIVVYPVTILSMEQPSCPVYLLAWKLLIVSCHKSALTNCSAGLIPWQVSQCHVIHNKIWTIMWRQRVKTKHSPHERRTYWGIFSAPVIETWIVCVSLKRYLDVFLWVRLCEVIVLLFESWINPQNNGRHQDKAEVWTLSRSYLWRKLKTWLRLEVGDLGLISNHLVLCSKLSRNRLFE